MIKKVLTLLILLTSVVTATTQAQSNAAMKKLQEQAKHFEQRVVQLTENVYVAVGFHGANTSMIVGNDGIIIVDTLLGPTAAANAFKAFRW